MALKAPGSLSSSLSSGGAFLRVGAFFLGDFLGDFVRLRLLPDPRLAGCPISSSVVVLAEDLDADALDVVGVTDLGVFDVVVTLAVG